MNNKSLLAILVIATVAIAGCTGPGGGGDTGGDEQIDITFTQNDGLSIDFSSVAPEYIVTDGAQATFRLRLQNTGGSEATLQNVWLTRQPWLAGDNLVADWSSSRKTLSGVDRSAQESGQIRQITRSVSLNPDDFDLSQGSSTTDTVVAKVKYDYSTQGRTQFSVMPRDQFLEENPTTQQATTDYTGAPVKVNVVETTPIQVSEGARTTSLKIVVSNVGDGKVVSTGGTSAGEVTVDTIELASGSGSINNCNPAGTGGEVTLYDGKSQIFCTLQFDSVPQSQLDYTLITEVSYTYQEQSQIQVTLSGG